MYRLCSLFSERVRAYASWHKISMIIFRIVYDVKKAGMHKAYRPKEFILLCMVDYLARPMSSSLKILSSITLTSLMIGLKSI